MNYKKNFIVYDDSCGFCMQSINRFKKILGDKVDYVGRSQFLANDYGLSEQDTKKTIQFVEFAENEAAIYSGANAIFKALAHNKNYGLLLVLYKYLPGFAIISELVYSFIAKNRSKLSCTVSLPKT